MSYLNYEIFFYYLFSSIALISALFVIYSQNTIYSVFFLILVFVNMTGLLIASNIEFLAIMLIIIYVGAITVLFLFVVMMLDIKIINLKKNNNYGYLPIILLISSLFFFETFLILNKTFTSYEFFISKNLETQTYYKLCKIWTRYPEYYEHIIHNYNNYYLYIDNITNIETIGHILYTYYTFFLLSAGLILLIALIGAVTLTNKEKKKKKFLTKNLYKQLSRNYLNAVYNVK